MPFKEAALLCLQLAESLHAAHELGIIHRDIKPANILLTEKGEPKITDFGLAKSNNSDMTGSFAQMGTPSYMAPELCKGKAKDAGPACDIYSLGATFYEILTGRVPFKGSTPLETMRLVIETEPVSVHVLRPGMPEALVTICQKCLQKEPKDRYQTTLELAADLGRFLQDQPILAREERKVEKVWRWCRKNPLIVSLAAMTTLVLVLGGVFLKSNLLTVNPHRDNFVNKEIERINRAISRVTEKPSNQDDYVEGMQKLNTLANELQNKGAYAKAESSFRELFELSKEHSPPNHLFTVELQYHLGTCLMLQDRYQEAEKNLLECNELLKQQKTIPLDWPVNSSGTLVDLYQRWKKPDLAEKWMEEQATAFRVWIPSIPYGTQEQYSGFNRFANLLEAINKYAEAADIWARYHDVLCKQDPQGTKRYEIESALGNALLIQKKYPEAESHLIKSYQGIRDRSQQITAAERKERLARHCQRIIDLYQSWDKRSEAEKWQTELGLLSK